jgi:hypothetical protein
MIRLWRNAWEQFTPFLAFPPEIRNIVEGQVLTARACVPELQAGAAAFRAVSASEPTPASHSGHGLSRARPGASLTCVQSSG